LGTHGIGFTCGPPPHNRQPIGHVKVLLDRATKEIACQARSALRRCSRSPSPVAIRLPLRRGRRSPVVTQREILDKAHARVYSNAFTKNRFGTDEIFEPVLSMIPVETLDDAIHLIGSSPCGRAASIFSEHGGGRASAGCVWTSATWASTSCKGGEEANLRPVPEDHMSVGLHTVTTGHSRFGSRWRTSWEK
jgi:hypothetical protein